MAQQAMNCEDGSYQLSRVYHSFAVLLTVLRTGRRINSYDDEIETPR